MTGKVLMIVVPGKVTSSVLTITEVINWLSASAGRDVVTVYAYIEVTVEPG